MRTKIFLSNNVGNFNFYKMKCHAPTCYSIKRSSHKKKDVYHQPHVSQCVSLRVCYSESLAFAVLRPLLGSAYWSVLWWLQRAPLSWYKINAYWCLALYHYHRFITWGVFTTVWFDSWWFRHKHYITVTAKRCVHWVPLLLAAIR